MEFVSVNSDVIVVDISGICTESEFVVLGVAYCLA